MDVRLQWISCNLVYTGQRPCGEQPAFDPKNEKCRHL